MRSFFYQLLRSKSAAVGIVQTAGTQGAILAINVATGIITARLLGPEGRGAFTAITVWGTLFGTLGSLGLPHAIAFTMKASGKRASGHILAAGLIIASVTAAGTTLVGYFIVPALVGQYGEVVERFAAYRTLLVPCIVYILLFRAVLLVDRRFIVYNAAQSVAPVAFLALLLVFVAFAELTPVAAAACLVLVDVPILIWLSRTALRGHRVRFDGVGSHLAAVWRYQRRLIPAEAAGAVLPFLDRILLVMLVSPRELGWYVVAYSLSRLIGALQKPVVAVLLPSIANRPRDEVAAVLARAIRFAMPVLLTGALGLAIIGRPLIAAVYGRDFVDAVPAFYVLVGEAVIGSLALLLGQGLLAINRPGAMSVSQTATLITASTAMLILVPRFGIVGAAMGLAIASLTQLVIVATYLRASGMRSFPLILRGDDLRYLRERFRGG